MKYRRLDENWDYVFGHGKSDYLEGREAVGLLTKTTFKKRSVQYAALAQNSTAAIVKAIDRCNNISTMMTSFPKDKIVRYVQETEKYVMPMLDTIKKEYAEYYDAIFLLKYQMLSVLESVKAAILRM